MAEKEIKAGIISTFLFCNGDERVEVQLSDLFCHPVVNVITT